jgi:molybdate transport system regulatory protein
MTAFQLKPRLMHGDQIAIGPGKADLLDAIAAQGSISAAARALGMSYRRAWQLVDVMNHCWSAPLVEAATGGRKGGGARLTDMGAKVLRAYRALDVRLTSEAEAAPEHAELARLLRRIS